MPIVSLCDPVRSTGGKAINKRCSKDLQAVVDGYCKFWVKSATGRVRFPVSGFQLIYQNPYRIFFTGETVNTAFITERSMK